MMKTGAMVVAGSVLFAIIGCDQPGKVSIDAADGARISMLSGQVTPDGRFGSRCYSWAIVESVEVCRVSFYRLLAVPEQYHGRVVAVAGYVKSAFGQYVLFPSINSVAANLDQEGILLEEVSLSGHEEIEAKNGVYPFFVIGTFDAVYTGEGDIPRLGALRNIETAQIWTSLPMGGTSGMD